MGSKCVNTGELRQAIMNLSGEDFKSFLFKLMLKKSFAVILSGILLLSISTGCQKLEQKNQTQPTSPSPTQTPVQTQSPTPKQTPTSTVSVHLTLGNPTNAGSAPDNYLMVKPQYALSYNRDRGIPNWVSWQLNQSYLGDVERQDDWSPDLSLKEDWYQVRPGDYRSSGYDRGHLTPSADRTRTVEDNSATFLMTNIIPQHPDNNREVWRELEEYTRDLVESGKELYIIAGGVGTKGAIANGKVVVPQQTWKVIAVLDPPGSGIQGITENTQTIAVIMPNSEAVDNTDWRDYLVSVDRVEQITGYDFFSNVPKFVQDEIERRVEGQPPTDQSNCSPAYPEVCIPPPPPDLDCSDIEQKNIKVLQPDPHKLDRNKDGVACL